MAPWRNANEYTYMFPLYALYTHTPYNMTKWIEQSTCTTQSHIVNSFVGMEPCQANYLPGYLPNYRAIKTNKHALSSKLIGTRIDDGTKEASFWPAGILQSWDSKLACCREQLTPGGSQRLLPFPTKDSMEEILLEKSETTSYNLHAYGTSYINRKNVP